MKYKISIMAIFLFLGISLAAQPSMQNYDMLRIEDIKGALPRSKHVTVKDNQILAGKGFKFIEVKQGFFLVPEVYNAKNPDVKHLAAGIKGFKMSLTAAKWYCEGSCECNPRKCGRKCLQCSGCCDIITGVGNGGITIPEYETPF